MKRDEHPNPQMRRKNWQNLNGEWEFEFDFGDSGIDRKLFEGRQFSKKINVPFCPESKLSGIGYKDFMNAVWYRKKISIDKTQLEGRVIIHFGAIDYKSHVYVNGQLAVKHTGGFSSFEADITEYLFAGENVITVYAKDDTKNPLQPRGKQSEKHHSRGCDYTRTTGIWQTVWLEFVPKNYIKYLKFTPNAKSGSVYLEAEIVGKGTLAAQVYYDGREVGSGRRVVTTDKIGFDIALDEIHLWEPGNGRLYEVVCTLEEDVLESYFGLRDIRMEGMKFIINDKPVFQRLVLDQGFYPDGIYTAPNEQALINDIELSMELGFNGARLHQKIFEPLFLYHCDRLGYMVWGEFPNWDLDYGNYEVFNAFAPEWIEAVRRDYNHPSIVGWCPFNETTPVTNMQVHDDILRFAYRLTRALDPTRPCIDTSGYIHQQDTDIYCIHDYEQNHIIFNDRYKNLAKDGTFDDFQHEKKVKTPSCYNGQPLFISEFGGARWDPDSKEGWGYGENPKSPAEFLERYERLVMSVLNNEAIFAFCYTQLYDIEQEKNGLLTYERKPKFDFKTIYEINTRKAAIEK